MKELFLENMILQTPSNPQADHLLIHPAACLSSFLRLPYLFAWYLKLLSHLI